MRVMSWNVNGIRACVRRGFGATLKHALDFRRNYYGTQRRPPARRRWCMNRNWPATILTQRLLTYRYRTTLARQGPSSDLGCCMRAAPRPFALLACALEGQCR